MIDREKVLGIIRIKGPVLPVQISKGLETSILFASAVLSELADAKVLKVSSVKIGGSPLYYLPEHAERLQDFAKHLPGKEKEAYELLKQKRILRDAEQEPAIRVALTRIKDYAWPLQVTIKENKELFWKWYLMKNEEAGEIIKKAMGIKEKTAVDENKEKVAESKKQKVVEQKQNEENVDNKTRTPNHVEENEEQKIIRKEKSKIEIPEPKAKTEKQLKIQKPQNNENLPDDAFLSQVLAFFSKNNINMLKYAIIRKNKEIDFIVELQSAVGGLRYYCKAKSKKKIGDGDLSTAYVQGQVRKLPVLFLSQGEPTKKAKEMLNKEFENMVFKNMEVS